MITMEERQQDTAAEQETTRREQEVEARRREIARQAHALSKRASKLRTKLDESTSDETTAALTGALEDIVEDAAWIQYSIYQLVAEAMATVLDDGEVVYSYTAADVKAWCDRAEELGYSRPRFNGVQLSDLVAMRLIPNAPFRERYLALNRSESDITSDIHRYLREAEERDGQDYGSKNFMLNGTPQTRQFERVIGLEGTHSSHGGGSLRLFIPYELGIALMRALTMTPQEAGL